MFCFHAGFASVSYIMDNTFHFYSQFLPAVTATIQQLAGPLEKEFEVIICNRNVFLVLLGFLFEE